jgi:hypothetical protein
MKLTIARLKSLIREELSRMGDTNIVNRDSGLGYDSQSGEIDAMGMDMSQIGAAAMRASEMTRGAGVTVMNVSQEAYNAFDQEMTIDELNPIQQDDGLYTLHF